MFTAIYVVMCRHAGTMSYMYICRDTDCCMASVVIAGWSLGARFIMRESFLSASETPVPYSDAIMGAMASEITSLMIVYSTVSSADQRKHQSYASLVFVRGIDRWPMNSPHKWPITRKFLPFDDVIVKFDGCMVLFLQWDTSKTPFSYWNVLLDSQSISLGM